MHKFISLGLGVQSTALYLMSSMGELPRVDMAIFVDPGREKTGTTKYLEWLLSWSENNNGIPITVVREKNLFEDLLNRTNSTGQTYRSIPAYVKNLDGEVGMLRRQCTNEYKIKQIETAIRRAVDVKSMRGRSVEIWQGISLDEWDRMNYPDTLWKSFIYPFTGYVITKSDIRKISDFPYIQMNRADILQWYEGKGLPIPPKSSCVFCPYQSDAAWKNMKENFPDDFADAVRIDEAIRDSTRKGIDQPGYLHRSMVPIAQANFSKGGDLWAGECSGNCHI